jgi:copper transport protein
LAAVRNRAAAALAAALLLGSPGAARAHAGLLSSAPAAGDTLRRAPTRLLLRFTEPVEASTSGLVLLAWNGRATTLVPRRDPADVTAIEADLPTLQPGGYRVQWRTLSADGHPVDGSFVFFIAGPDGMISPAPAERATETAGGSSIPVLAVLLRGVGVGVLAALCGILLFGIGAVGERPIHRITLVLAWAAPLLLAAHAVAWAIYARGTGDEPLGRLLLGTLPGRVEVVRAVCALLALWGLALARRPGLALAFAAAAVVASGLTGHAAALHPGWTVPAKAIHVAAVAVWTGGLAALFVTVRREVDLRALALRVSSLSLAAVIVLIASGVLQTLLFAPGLALLARSAYGAVILAKLVGLAVLAAIGARNRYRLVPRLPAEEARAALRRSVGWELGVMVLVMLVAGLLAYVPVPRPHPSAAAHASHLEMN